MKRFWTVIIITLLSLAALPASALAAAPPFERFNSAPTVDVVHEPETSVTITFQENTGPLMHFEAEGRWVPTSLRSFQKEDPWSDPPAYGGGGEGGWPAF